MKILSSPIQTTIKEHGVAAIGRFDGVHIGHKYLFSQMKRLKKKEDKVALFILPDIKDSSLTITSTEEKISLLQEEGIDTVFFLPNDFKLNNLIGELQQYFSFHRLFFGKDNYVKEKNKYISYVPLVQKKGEIVSSTRIKNYLEQGLILSAQKLLGREFTFKVHSYSSLEVASEPMMVFPITSLLPSGMYSVSTSETTLLQIVKGKGVLLSKERVPPPFTVTFLNDKNCFI